MAKSKTAKKSAPSGAEVDPRFAPVAAAFAKTPGFSIMGSKSGALQGMMLHGKSFGMSTHGRFVLKVDEARAEALIAEGTAEAFEMRPGKPMKGWIEVTSPRADWVALAKEAYRIAADAGAAKKGGAKKGAAKKRARR